MTQIVLDAAAGQVSAKVDRRGVAANVRVHAPIEVVDDPALPMGATAWAGNGFD